MPTKVHLAKLWFSSSHVWMWELDYRESCVKVLMLLNGGAGEDSRGLWTARRSNQSILKEISPEYSLERLMLKLKLQYFGHLMGRADSFEKTLMLGKIEGGKRRGHRGWDVWMASPSHWTWAWVSSGGWGWTGTWHKTKLQLSQKFVTHSRMVLYTTVLNLMVFSTDFSCLNLTSSTLYHL